MAGDAIGVSDVWRTDLELDSTAFTMVQSASGKGKTTLLSICYGLRKDYEGVVYFEGKDIRTKNEQDWADWRSGRCSLLFQDLKLFRELTALENIRLKADLSNSFDQKQVEQWAEKLGVDRYLNKACGRLSLGQQQRMALIRSLSQPFDWLLLDEPFSHLDTENVKLACELITEVCQQRGAGLMLSTLGESYFLEYDRKLKI